jgi:YYY domain-containing protein
MNNEIAIFISWYVLIGLFGLLVFPLTFTLFRSIPDRGVTVIKGVGLLVISYLHWLLCSLGLSHNTVGGILIAVFAVTTASLWVFFKQSAGIKTWLKSNWKLILSAELLFLLAFIGMALVRAQMPDISGTEKPMEFMFINSILRSDTFPPQDAWLTGYGISYYYFGYVMVALITMLTQTNPAIAFNLAIALVFALTAIGAFGVAYNLITHQKKHEKTEGPLFGAIGPALLAPLLILVMGNFYGFLDVLHNHNQLKDFQVPAVWFHTADPINQDAVIKGQPGIRSGLIDFWTWMDLKLLDRPQGDPRPIENLDQPYWWFASRTVHDRNLAGNDYTEVIDEFPAFSFLLADLHPHVLALPFVTIVILLCLEWLFYTQANIKEEKSDYWLHILFSALILGSLIFLNTWDFPIYAFLFILAGLIGLYSRREPPQALPDFKSFIRTVSMVLLGAVIFYLPFILSLQSQAGGILPNLVYSTRLRQIIVAFWPFLLPVVAFVIWSIRRPEMRFDRKIAWRVALIFLGSILLVVITLSLVILLNPERAGIVAQYFAPFGVNLGISLVLQRRLVESGTALLAVMLISVSAGLIWGGRRESDSTPRFLFAMILTGALLLAGPEFVYLRDNFGYRMNTVFKFYYQIWVLWSLATTYILWRLFTRLQGVRLVVWSALVAVTLLPGLVYPIGNLGRIFPNAGQATDPTLDGMRFFTIYHPNDWAAIEWLQTNVTEPVVILEGSFGAYWVDGPSSRFSMATGLPTLMGWANHEGQWRGEGFRAVDMRENEIRTIYTEHDWGITQTLLDKYKVQYVIVTQWETTWYGTVNQAKFDTYLQRVFESGDVIIYKR